MNNFEKWSKENITPDVVWLSITTGESNNPCKECPAHEHCEGSDLCCYKSFMEWANK